MKNFSMKCFFYLFVVLSVFIYCPLNVSATVIQGGINTNDVMKVMNTVVDKSTGKPVPNAKIVIPSGNYVTYTDINGHFEIKAQIKSPAIMSVEKPSYKPFSMTVTKGMQSSPFVISIETFNPFDISLETRLCHLGDNNFSSASANAGSFKTTAVGPVYSRDFFVGKNHMGKQYYLVIGSIVGIDTALARGMGQNRITTSFASPPSVYLNGQKIAEIQINGDNQKIRLPHNLLRFNQKNLITIRAGRNLMQTAYVDYDDIEFTNLGVEVINQGYN